MQGQRNSVGSIPEPRQIDLSSNSNSSGMDQPFYPSNVLLNSVETPTLADYLLSPNNTKLDFLNMVPQGTDGLSIWNSQGPNSNAYVANRENHDETKMDHGWNTALSISSVGGTRMEESRCDGISILPLENVDLNLNNSPVDDGQTTQGLISSHSSQSAEQNAHVCPYRDGLEVSMCPFMPEFFEPEHAPYSNSDGRSSNGVGLFSEDYGRARSSADGRPVACKRKNMEGVIGESSTSRDISADLTTLSSSWYLPVASSMDENQNPSLIHLHRGISSEWYPPSSLSGNVETSQRNLRVRLNSACPYDISPSQSNSSMGGSRLSSIWSPVEPSSVLNAFVHPAEQSHLQILPVPGLPHHSSYSPSISRIRSSSTLAYQQWRLIASPEETSTRSLPGNSIADHPAFLSSTNVHRLLQDLPNLNPCNSSLSMSGSGASSSTVGISLSGPIRAPSDMVPVQYPRNLSEVVRSSLFLSSESAAGHQSCNVPSWHPGSSASTQEPGQTSRTVHLGHSLPNPRTAASVERQRYGVSGLPFSARSRDGRNRMISEIRNALDLMRRGVNLGFEDIFIFDQSGFYGRADLYDRHRDMRLDVDNMSYEELLALEERIGYVNTGLSEDAILKTLRQRKYLPCKLEVAFTEQEPCCICREDYSDGEDIGTLECKHDFHTVCIKQWLMIKNLCPICKTTALVTRRL